MLPYGVTLDIILPPTVLFTVKELKLKGHDDTQNCVILCVSVTKHKKKTHSWVYENWIFTN